MRLCCSGPAVGQVRQTGVLPDLSYLLESRSTLSTCQTRVLLRCREVWLSPTFGATRAGCASSMSQVRTQLLPAAAVAAASKAGGRASQALWARELRSPSSRACTRTRT